MNKEEKDELEALQDLERHSLVDIREAEERYNQAKHIEEMCDYIFNTEWKEEWEEIE